MKRFPWNCQTWFHGRRPIGTLAALIAVPAILRKGNRPGRMPVSLFERARRRHHSGNAALVYARVRTLIAPPKMKQPPAARRYFLQIRLMSAKARAATTPHTEPPHRHSAASTKPTGIFSSPCGCTCPEPRQNPAHIRQLPYSIRRKSAALPHTSHVWT